MLAVIPWSSGRSKGLSFASGVLMQRLIGELGTPKSSQISLMGNVCTTTSTSDLRQGRLWTMLSWNFRSMNRTFKFKAWMTKNQMLIQCISTCYADYRKTSNRSRAPDRCQALHTGRRFWFTCTDRSRASVTSRVLHISQGLVKYGCCLLVKQQAMTSFPQ